MTHPFSPAGRQAALAEMEQGELDLLIIGGGITGCGLARDATLRGIRVGLVEKEDFAYGTSSRSSKLVHGGLRYLSEGDPAMVWESIRERQVLALIAPHLVHPLEFVYPWYPGESTVAVRLAFWLLEGLTGAMGHRQLDAAGVLARAPGLAGAVGGIAYGDYITDDSRLTLENGLSAARHGALVANHARVIAFLGGAGRVTGAVVQDGLSSREYRVRARVVVNATGPWAAATLQLALAGGRPESEQEPVGRERLQTDARARTRIRPSRGVHLLFRADRLPVAGAVVLRPPGGMRGFAIPRGDYIYVGTTDETYDGSLDHPAADGASVGLLMKLVRDSFPDLGLTTADVLATWAGLRPLVYKQGNPRHASRHDQIWHGPDGLITIAGGKMTTYRRMAHRIIEHMARELRQSLPRDRQTASELLPGAQTGVADMAVFRAGTAAAFAARGVPERAVRRINWLYGAQAQAMLRLGEDDPAWLQPLGAAGAALRAEVKLAVEEEMALTLLDFMDRRAGLLLFSDDHGRAAAEDASRIMADLLAWSEDERLRQLTAYRAAAHAHDVP